MRSVTYRCSCGEEFKSQAARRAHEKLNRGHQASMILATIEAPEPKVFEPRTIVESPARKLKRWFAQGGGPVEKPAPKPAPANVALPVARINVANIRIHSGAFGNTGFNCGDRVHRIDDEGHEGRVQAVTSGAITVRWDGDPPIIERGIDPRELRRIR